MGHKQELLWNQTFMILKKKKKKQKFLKVKMELLSQTGNPCDLVYY